MKGFKVVMLAGAIALAPNTYAADKSQGHGQGHGHGHAPHWGYSGAEGPEFWGDLSKDFAVCKTGTKQSPIDIRSAIEAELATLEFNYTPVPLKVLNNGHTIQVPQEGAGTVKLRGKEYKLLQFHFHAPSEHTTNGKPAPMEVHLVHKSEDGQLAVVGVYMSEGRENAALKAVFDNMPRSAGETEVKSASFNPADLLPSDKGQDFHHYIGSLTTPPCSEGVRWIVLDQGIEVSKEQVAAFKAIFPMNARPVQPHQDRFLLHADN